MVDNPKPYLVSAVGSLACHLVFAMTAGAYFLTREAPPEMQEVRVQIIEKEKPKPKEFREPKVKPVVEVVPVMQPQEVAQPITPQQVVQVASVQPISPVQPMVMEATPTPTATPQVQRMTPKTLTASVSAPKPMRSAPVPTMVASKSTVAPVKSRVSAYQAPNTTPVMKSVTTTTPTVTTARATVRRGRAVTRNISSPTARTVVSTPVTSAQGKSGPAMRRSSARSVAVASARPMAVSQTKPTSSGTRGNTMRHSSARPIDLAVATPRAVTPAAESGPRGARGTQKMTSGAKQMRMAALSPLTPIPVEEEVVTSDPGALKGYENKVYRRLSFISRKHYKRSSAKRAQKQGKVLIAFTLLPDGSIKNPYVKTPSKHVLINQAAMQALKKAAPFSEFPEGVVDGQLNMVVPISFTLR